MAAYQEEVALLKALGHPLRLAILEALREDEMCVCHLMALFGCRQAYISQQLMVLRSVGLLADRREGMNVYYRVVKPEIYTLIDALHQVVQGAATREVIPNVVLACTCPRCQSRAEKSGSSMIIEGEILS